MGHPSVFVPSVAPECVWSLESRIFENETQVDSFCKGDRCSPNSGSITRRRIVCAWARVGCVLWDNFPDGAGAGLLVPEPKVPEGVLGLLI